MLLVSEHADFRDAAVVHGTVSEHGIARFEVAGLRPATLYRLAIGTAADSAAPVGEASFRTFPVGPASFTIAAGSCARVGSNGAVFDAIAALDPALFVIDGDFHYANIDRNDEGLFRDVLDLALGRPGQSALYRSTPIAYVWDDHDYGGNNADRTSPTQQAAWNVYREYVPHYPLAGANNPISQAFDIGRVRVILTDTRSARSPASQLDDQHKTMLGEQQKAWFKHELLAANDTHPLIIWVNPDPWIGEVEAGADGWGGYSTERAELADFIAANDIDGLLMLSGDAHMVAIDDGTNTDYSAEGNADFPLLHAGALDRPGHIKGGPYSEGAFPGGGQFGTIQVEDSGDRLVVRLSGRNWKGDVLVEYEYELPNPSTSSIR
jgi:phosphodiesterase/alkaline phosphatase D-like protein